MQLRPYFEESPSAQQREQQCPAHFYHLGKERRIGELFIRHRIEDRQGSAAHCLPDNDALDIFLGPPKNSGIRGLLQEFAHTRLIVCAGAKQINRTGGGANRSGDLFSVDVKILGQLEPNLANNPKQSERDAGSVEKVRVFIFFDPLCVARPINHAEGQQILFETIDKSPARRAGRNESADRLMSYSSQVLERPPFLGRLVEQAVFQRRCVGGIFRIVAQMHARLSLDYSILLITPLELVVLVEHDVEVRTLWRTLFRDLVGHRLIARARIGVDGPGDRVRGAAAPNLQIFRVGFPDESNDLLFLSWVIEPVRSYGNDLDNGRGAGAVHISSCIQIHLSG